MKIVFVLPGIGISGGVRVTITAAKHLINRGHEVRLLGFKPPMTPKDWLKVAVERTLYHSRSWIDDFKGGVSFFKNIASCIFDRDEIIVGVGMWASNQLGTLMTLPNPKLQYIHGATPWDPELMARTFRLPMPKVVVASYLKPIVESSGGTVLAVIPNGIDRHEYFPSLPESDRRGVGTVFGTNWAKDPETITAVVTKISRMKASVPIRMFGTSRKPFRLPCLHYRRVPSVEEARKMYSQSLVWFLASRSEGFPAPPLEAMACGCVVVSTACGGIDDIIVDGVNGLIVPVGDADQLVDKIFLLLNNHDLRNRLRKNADDTIKKFTWQCSVDCLENALLTLS